MLIALFFSFLLLTLTILLAGTRQKTLSKSLRQRLLVVRDSAQNARTGAPLLDLVGENDQGLFKRFSTWLERFRFYAKFERLLVHAGSTSSVSSLVLGSAGLSLIAALVMLLATGKALLACCGFFAGAVAPYAWLRRKRTKRLNRFDDAMPDAIDLMARSLRAGHSMTAAIEIIAEQSAKPLAQEFERIFQQQRLGVRLREALLEATERTPSADFHFLVTAILVQRESGGDLTEILDRTTHVIRERVRIRGEVRVYTAQGRMSGWILSLLPVILLLLINLVDPGYSNLLFHDATGQKMLATGTVLICLGGFIINRIVDIRV